MLHFNNKKKFETIKPTTPLSSLDKFFEKYHIGFVMGDDGAIKNVMTKIDVLRYLTKNPQ